jgi:hypothetical protein
MFAHPTELLNERSAGIHRLYTVPLCLQVHVVDDTAFVIPLLSTICRMSALWGSLFSLWLKSSTNNALYLFVKMLARPVQLCCGKTCL